MIIGYAFLYKRTYFISSIYLATAIILFWYSIETRYLKEETKYANKINILPVIVFLRDEHRPEWIYMKNIGLGSAVNIKIEIDTIPSELNNFVRPFLMGAVDVLMSGEDHHLLSLQDKKLFDELKKDKTHKLILSCSYNRVKRLNEKPFKTKAEFDNDGLRLIRSSYDDMD
ncbi:hypothetical protein HYT45_00095 [Candidatus Uhrbacteria bacterium]|nr:hypothetical protein [Candidatus Uhrbacteria bacterium]